MASLPPAPATHPRTVWRFSARVAVMAALTSVLTASAASAASAAADSAAAQPPRGTAAPGAPGPRRSADDARAPAAPAPAPRPIPRAPDRSLLGQFDALKYEALGLLGIITYAGVRDWKWGTAAFRFQPEHWFQMDTGSGGQDKIGHGFSTHLMTQALYLRLRNEWGENAGAALAPALISWTLMLYVEVFDGYSVDHGFSKEDLTMDTFGAGTALLKSAFPRVGRFVDFRMQYYPSAGQKSFHPMIDYSGQRFLLAFHPSAFSALERTPLRFLELYLGYYTRGFQRGDRADRRLARVFAGVGVDLSEALATTIGRAEDNPGSVVDFLHTAARSFQLPYRYPEVTLHQRTAPSRHPE